MTSSFPHTAGNYVHRMRRPFIVNEIIGHGADARVTILRDNPTRVLKYCFPDDEDAAQNLDQEKNILALFGRHPLLIRLQSVSERGLILEYYPLGSLRDYYSKALPPYVHRCHERGFRNLYRSLGLRHAVATRDAVRCRRDLIRDRA